MSMPKEACLAQRLDHIRRQPPLTLDPIGRVGDGWPECRGRGRRQIEWTKALSPPHDARYGVRST